MKNEQLLLLTQLASELYTARIENDRITAALNHSRNAQTEANCLCDDLKKQVKTSETTITALRGDCKFYGDRIKELTAERDSAHRKLGALCQVIRCVDFDLNKVKRPRIFLKELKDAFAKCIKDNNITVTGLGVAQ